MVGKSDPQVQIQHMMIFIHKHILTLISVLALMFIHMAMVLFEMFQAMDNMHG
jgi:hypothetical protein